LEKVSLADKCRFDYVIAAIEGLGKYMDSSPITTNTAILVEGVHQAIHILEGIEKVIASEGPKTKKRKAYGTAFTEARDQLAALKPQADSIKEFFDENALKMEALQHLTKTFSKVVKDSTDAALAFRKINIRIDSMFKRFERELGVVIPKPAKAEKPAKGTTGAKAQKKEK